MTNLNTSLNTGYNKYPALFAAAQEVHELSNKFFLGEAKVLSFGCSTGQEVKTLHDLYFKYSAITGCDINEDALAEAETYFLNKHVHYNSIEHLAGMEKKFDVVFCLNVLCKPQAPDAPPARVEYNDFDKTITFLKQFMQAGSYLVVYNSNYSVMQSTQKKCFEPVKHRYVNKSADAGIPLLNPNGTPRRDDGICIFKKINNEKPKEIVKVGQKVTVVVVVAGIKTEEIEVVKKITDEHVILKYTNIPFDKLTGYKTEVFPGTLVYIKEIVDHNLNLGY